jgi:squalene-associated FAD-dependent desaturase
MSAGASERQRVLVIGGGLAGIAAALDCAAAGANVTLVEVRRRLGGAAYSFERDGLALDNGQHVFLRCCHAYRALLARLGSERLTFVQPRLEIPVLSPEQAPAWLRRDSLPAPAHLALSLARYPHLTPGERVGAARAALGLMRLDPSDPALESETFGGWLARHGQRQRAVAALWDLIALPTLNLPAAEASLALAAFVFRTGLLSGADAGDIGFHRGTLAETIGIPAERALREAGVAVRFGWRAERIERSGNGVEVHGRGARGESESVGLRERLSAEATILAVPHMRAVRLLEPLLGERAGVWRGLGSSPIINLHVVYDRVVCDVPFAAGVGTPMQYVFDRSDAAGVPDGHQYLAVSLSGAEHEMAISSGELRERYLAALGALFPRAREASVEFFLATREHAATFRAAPGVGALRPGPQTALPGLVLAGAWTATGWPATLEGAVLSGHTAADTALRGLGLDPGGDARARVGAEATGIGPARSTAPAAAVGERELAR